MHTSYQILNFIQLPNKKNWAGTDRFRTLHLVKI
jgi:hypothetical protein